jgi:hypothetical protein
MPSEAERADPKLFSDNVRALMGQRLGATLSQHSIKDNLELKRHGIYVDWAGRIRQREPTIGVPVGDKRQPGAVQQPSPTSL